MEDDINRRIRVLSMSLRYQTWRDSFMDPVDYRPELYKDLELEDDLVITFGYRGSSVKVPLILFCSISKKLQVLLLSRPRRGLSISLKGEPAYPFWWLRRFLEHKTPLPGAEGTALVLMMAYKYDIVGLVRMSREKLRINLGIENFPYVFNSAVETEDKLMLDQCRHMIASWTDELLSLPNLSVLGRRAMIDLLACPRIAPSSELIVFNCIINWWRNSGKKCYEDLCFLDDLRCCLDKVRFLQMTEEDFKHHVLPSGVIPFEDVEVMLQMLRGERGPVRGFAYYIHDPVLQATPRPKLLKVANFGLQLADDTVPELKLLYTKNEDKRYLAWFTVDKRCYVRRVSSASLMDQGGGTLTVASKRGCSTTQKWLHCSCTFDQPVVLYPFMHYDFIHKGDTGRSDKECSVSIKKTVRGVTFEGLLYCKSLTLEFTTTDVESESESDSSESERSAGLSSSDGTDSIEMIREAEIRMTELEADATGRGRVSLGRRECKGRKNEAD